MRNILKTTLATTFAIACISGASVAFAADNNNGGNNNGGNHNNNSHGQNLGKKDPDALQIDPNATGSVKCDNGMGNKAGCADSVGTHQQQ